jgi:hypothetical protein
MYLSAIFSIRLTSGTMEPSMNVYSQSQIIQSMDLAAAASSIAQGFIAYPRVGCRCQPSRVFSFPVATGTAA